MANQRQVTLASELGLLSFGWLTSCTKFEKLLAITNSISETRSWWKL